MPQATKKSRLTIEGDCDRCVVFNAHDSTSVHFQDSIDMHVLGLLELNEVERITGFGAIAGLKY